MVLNGPVPLACRLVLLPIGALFVFGMIRLHYNLPVFREWIREDRLVEWVTCAGLAAMAALAFVRAAALEAAVARRAWIVVGLVLLFGAIEEISWGQRVFGWHRTSAACSSAGMSRRSPRNATRGAIPRSRAS